MKRSTVCIVVLNLIVIGIIVVAFKGRSGAQKDTSQPLCPEVVSNHAVKAGATQPAAPAPSDDKTTSSLSRSCFAGRVKGELLPKSDGNSFTLVFYEKGTYRVSFSQDSGWTPALPRTFDIVVNSTPTTKAVGNMPNRFRATISRNQVSESLDFDRK